VTEIKEFDGCGLLLIVNTSSNRLLGAGPAVPGSNHTSARQQANINIGATLTAQFIGGTTLLRYCCHLVIISNYCCYWHRYLGKTVFCTIYYIVIMVKGKPQVAKSQSNRKSSSSNKAAVSSPAQTTQSSSKTVKSPFSAPQCCGCGTVINDGTKALQCDGCMSPDIWKCADCLHLTADIYGVWLITTSDNIGPHRATSDYVGPHRGT